MPAILFVRPEGTPPQAEPMRINADHIISYTGDRNGTVLVVQGAGKPIPVQESVTDIDTLLGQGGYTTAALRRS